MYYTVSIDTATFKQRGLTKHLGIHARFWDDTLNRVRDVFLGLVPLGHEHAQQQVHQVMTFLENENLPVNTILGFSRDNPNVMKSFAKKMDDLTKQAGNPGLIDQPDFLHPVHTSFRHICEALSVDMYNLLTCLHSFFKQSTARREDFCRLRADLHVEIENFEESLDTFCMRPVTTRYG